MKTCIILDTDEKLESSAQRICIYFIKAVLIFDKMHIFPLITVKLHRNKLCPLFYLDRVSVLNRFLLEKMLSSVFLLDRVNLFKVYLSLIFHQLIFERKHACNRLFQQLQSPTYLMKNPAFTLGLLCLINSIILDFLYDDIVHSHQVQALITQVPSFLKIS